MIDKPSPGLLRALTLGAAQCDKRAAELASCKRCHQRPELYTDAAAALRDLAQLLEHADGLSQQPE